MNEFDWSLWNVAAFAPSDDGDGDGDDSGSGGDDAGNGDDSVPNSRQLTGLLSKSGDDNGGDDDGDGKAKDPPKEGERPEYIPEKFWNAEKGEPNLEAWSRSHKDMEATLGRLRRDKGDVPDAPDKYFTEDAPFQIPEKADRVSMQADDPGLQIYAKVAHKHGLSRDQMQGVMRDVMLEFNQSMPEPYNAEAELAKLGEGGEKIVRTNLTWLDGLHKSKVLNDQHWAVIDQMTQTAGGVDLLNIMRQLSGDKPMPLPGNANTGGGLTRAEFQRRMNKAVAENDQNAMAALDKQAQDEGLFES